MMVVRGRPPNDHAVMGLARGMVEMFHLRAVAESRKFPSAPESRGGVTSVRTSLDGKSKGQLSARSWRVCTGRGTHQDSPLHWWALTFKGH